MWHISSISPFHNYLLISVNQEVFHQKLWIYSEGTIHYVFLKVLFKVSTTFFHLSGNIRIPFRKNGFCPLRLSTDRPIFWYPSSYTCYLRTEHVIIGMAMFCEYGKENRQFNVSYYVLIGIAYVYYHEEVEFFLFENSVRLLTLAPFPIC